MKKILGNNKGISLAEIIVSIGLLGIVTYVFTGSSSMMSDLNSDVKNKMNLERTAISIFEKVQNNVSHYQVTNNPSNFLKVTNKEELHKKLPLAWNDKFVVNVDQCKFCKGRLGFIITPHLEYRGLYKLIIRATHTELIDTFKEYNFLINGN